MNVYSIFIYISGILPYRREQYFFCKNPVRLKHEMDSSDAGTVTDSRRQPSKALEPSLLRPSGSVRLASDEQPEKAPSPTRATEAGSVTEAKDRKSIV